MALSTLLLWPHVACQGATDEVLSVGEVRIRYHNTGRGTTVVLLHGFGEALDVWQSAGIVRLLSPHFRVVAIDLRGHGRSSKPHVVGAYGRELAADVVRLLDLQRVARAHIVGYSLGGLIALDVAACHPDRVLSAVLFSRSRDESGPSSREHRSKANMHLRPGALAACLLWLVVSCGSPSTPTEAPDVRGSWNGGADTWRWSDSYTYASDVFRTAACEGTVDITEQDGNAFGGRYTIRCTGAPTSAGAVVGGRVARDGRLRFQLIADEGWEPGLPPGWFNLPCRLTADTAYEGNLVNAAMSVRRVQDFDCPPGGVRVSHTFEGARR